MQRRDPRAGTVLDSATFPAPKGIALDNTGNMLAISEGRVRCAGLTNGVRVKQWQCNGGTNQHWKFEAVTSP